MRPRLLSALLRYSGFFVFVGALHAQFTWDGDSTAGSNITDAQNWTPGLPTGSGTENAIFDASGARINIVVPTNLAFNNVTFGTSRPLYTFSGTSSPVLGINGNVSVLASSNPVTFNSSLSLNLDAGYHTVDVAGSGTLLAVGSNIIGTGGINKTGLGVMALTGSSTYTGGTIIRAGTLNINVGSVTQGTGEMTVGDLSGDVGTLTITNGGDLTNNTSSLGLDAGSTGTANVTGNGSTWAMGTINVGYSGTGNLNISSDADVTGGATFVGLNTGSTGTITLDGAGSTLIASTLDVGTLGTGTLTITNGGVATSSSLSYIADDTGSSGTVTVDGSGSSLSYTSLFLARRGTGMLTLSNGGKVTVNAGAGTITLAQLTGSTGTLRIGGASAAPGGIVNAATITTGVGAGTVLFNTTATSTSPYYLTKDGTSGGAPVIIAGATKVQQSGGYNVLNGNNTYTGTTTITGGTLVAGSNSAFGTSAVTLNGGKLSVANGVNFSNLIGIGVNGGTLAGNGNFTSPLTLGTGVTLAPGNSVGTLNFASGLTLNNGGTLDIEIQAPTGTPGTNWDLLDVTGTLNLGGLSAGGYTLKAISLDLSGNPGAVSGLTGPASWTIAITTAISGFQAADFAIDFSQFTGGGNFTLSQSGNNLMLNFTPVPEPSTYALMAAGLIVAGLGYRRRKNRSA